MQKGRMYCDANLLRFRYIVKKLKPWSKEHVGIARWASDIFGGYCCADTERYRVSIDGMSLDVREPMVVNARCTMKFRNWTRVHECSRLDKN
jgi:hypothetical protein